MVNTELLKEYKLKVTPQRVAIVNELHHHGHMNIDDLYKSLLNQFPSISLATIYKNINAMIEKLFISEVKIPHEKSVFELTKTEHSHLVCESCNHIEDIMIDTSMLLEEVKSTSHFTITGTSVIFSGTCSRCSK